MKKEWVFTKGQYIATRARQHRTVYQVLNRARVVGRMGNASDGYVLLNPETGDIAVRPRKWVELNSMLASGGIKVRYEDKPADAGPSTSTIKGSYVDRSKYELNAPNVLNEVDPVFGESWSKEPSTDRNFTFWRSTSGRVAGTYKGNSFNMLAGVVVPFHVERQWCELSGISEGELQIARDLYSNDYAMITYKRDVEKLYIEANRLGFELMPKAKLGADAKRPVMALDQSTQEDARGVRHGIPDHETGATRNSRTGALTGD
jgi:hypothetical protein